MVPETFPFRHTVNATKVVDTDRRETVEPAAADLAAIAEAYQVLAIDRLKAEFVLKPYRKAGVRVVGPISMAVRQTCSVTLEPFDSTFVMDVDRAFEPASSRPRRARDLNEDGEIEISLDTIDPPDVMMDGVLDLGAVICEELALNLDPFPRKPGAAFEGRPEADEPADDEDDRQPSPFAALEGFKPNQKN